MRARLVALLLIVALQACPLLCKAGPQPEGSSRSAAQGCCAHCASRGSDHSESRTHLPPVRNNGDSTTQCICAGAIVDKSDLFQVSIERSQLDVLAALPPTSVTAVAAGNVAPVAVGTFCHYATPGRLLCRLKMVLLI